jgi:ATP citrate (pro-S)-lyase
MKGDWILFTHEGGVDVGDVDTKAEKLLIPVDLKKLVYPRLCESL